MNKTLFFDDSKLFVRDNVIRKYGQPKKIATLFDPCCCSVFPGNFVFKLDNGSYRWIICAIGKAFSGKKVFSYSSMDGIHFKPEDLRSNFGVEETMYPHEIPVFKGDFYGEIGTIYEDRTSNTNQRYKMLLIDIDSERLWVRDLVYTSPDLLHWTILDGACWGDGAEPPVSVFFNQYSSQHTIVERPFWGVRQIGYKTTRDWKNYSSFNYCMTIDSIDEPLSEMYGMFAFEYDGMFIGLPHIYRNLHNEYNAKYSNGNIDTQLAYSYDGRDWNRSLREPFISGFDGASRNSPEQYPLMWVFGLSREENGDILLYGSGSRLEHGPAFTEYGYAEMQVYHLRKDGFVMFASDDSNRPSLVATRENVWHGGSIHVNLKAEMATMEVRVSEEDISVSANVLGKTHLVEGYRHDDCIPFSGDCVDWVPEYRSGKHIGDLAGKVLVFEVRFLNGELYSLYGDYSTLFNTEAARYRRFGIMPR